MYISDHTCDLRTWYLLDMCQQVLKDSMNGAAFDMGSLFTSPPFSSPQGRHAASFETGQSGNKFEDTPWSTSSSLNTPKGDVIAPSACDEYQICSPRVCVFVCLFGAEHGLGENMQRPLCRI